MPVELKPAHLSTGLKLATGLGLIALADLVVLPGEALGHLAGRPRRWARRVAPPVSRSLLRLFGVAVALPDGGPWPAGQVVYVSNHVSTMDPFVVVGLGLPGTRYFLSGYLRRVPAFGLLARLLGTFFTPSQDDQPARARCFAGACDELRRTGESVYLTPEGKMVRTGQIGPFNKGAFHLAIALGATLQPLYLEVPAGLDPGTGFDLPGQGTITVHRLAPLDAREWTDLEALRDEVRARFVAFHLALRGSLSPSR